MYLRVRQIRPLLPCYTLGFACMVSRSVSPTGHASTAFIPLKPLGPVQHPFQHHTPSALGYLTTSSAQPPAILRPLHAQHPFEQQIAAATTRRAPCTPATAAPQCPQTPPPRPHRCRARGPAAPSAAASRFGRACLRTLSAPSAMPTASSPQSGEMPSDSTGAGYRDACVTRNESSSKILSAGGKVIR